MALAAAGLVAAVMEEEAWEAVVTVVVDLELVLMEAAAAVAVEWEAAAMGWAARAAMADRAEPKSVLASMAVAATAVAATAVEVPAAGLEMEMVEVMAEVVTVPATLVGAAVNQLQRLRLVQVPREAAERAVAPGKAGLAAAEAERAAATARARAVSLAAEWAPCPGAMAVAVAAPWVARSCWQPSR